VQPDLADHWLPEVGEGFADHLVIVEEPDSVAPDLDLSDEPGVFPWLTDAADLLAEPDPGPTPMLVEGLIVDQALVAAVGRWKTMKSYTFLDLAISVRTGRPAFGQLEIPEPGPVVFVIEESGRAALWRRLDALRRGRGIDRDELRGLHVAANERVRLDDLEWQQRLIDAGMTIRPRLIVFDPLARMKAAARKENEQTDMAVVIESLRTLRDETGATVGFVHHTGHTGNQMRGSSDLESVWETRLTWERDGQSPTITLKAEHREAEPGDPLVIRAAWDADTRSLRFDLIRADEAAPLEQRIAKWLQGHPDQTAEQVAKGIQTRVSDVRNALNRMEAGTTHGTTHSGPSGRRDASGRPIRDKVWNLTDQAGLWHGPQPGPTQDDPAAGHRGTSQRPTPSGGPGTAEPPRPGPDETEIERLAALSEQTLETTREQAAGEFFAAFHDAAREGSAS
jgi:hypothetical protein